MSTVSSTTSTNENGFKAFIKSNPLISMYVLLFVIAWSAFINAVTTIFTFLTGILFFTIGQPFGSGGFS